MKSTVSVLILSEKLYKQECVNKLTIVSEARTEDHCFGTDQKNVGPGIEIGAIFSITNKQRTSLNDYSVNKVVQIRVRSFTGPYKT